MLTGLFVLLAAMIKSVCLQRKAGTAVGIAGVFIETHEKPETAPSDGASMLPLDQLSGLLSKIKAIDNVVKSFD